jgi:hypothetical protein
MRSKRLTSRCDEQALRFNERKDNDEGRLTKPLSGVVGKGLRYAKPIAAEGGDGPCPAQQARQMTVEYATESISRLQLMRHNQRL